MNQAEKYFDFLSYFEQTKIHLSMVAPGTPKAHAADKIIYLHTGIEWGISDEHLQNFRIIRKQSTSIPVTENQHPGVNRQL